MRRSPSKHFYTSNITEIVKKKKKARLRNEKSSENSLGNKKVKYEQRTEINFPKEFI